VHVTPCGGMQGVTKGTQRQPVTQGPTTLTKTQVCGKQMCMAGQGMAYLALHWHVHFFGSPQGFLSPMPDACMLWLYTWPGVQYAP